MKQLRILSAILILLGAPAATAEDVFVLEAEMAQPSDVNVILSDDTQVTIEAGGHMVVMTRSGQMIRKDGPFEGPASEIMTELGGSGPVSAGVPADVLHSDCWGSDCPDYRTPLSRAIDVYWRGDHKTAVLQITRLAEEGDLAAQLWLGRMFATGKDAPRDYAKAMKWFRKAAEQGSTEAQFAIGQMYRYGTGVSPDMAEAIKWYRKAAEQGLISAHVSLAASAARSLAGMAAHGDLTAFEAMRDLADRGNVLAQYNVARLYDRGDGVAEDDAEAVKWYFRAARQGSTLGLHSLRELAEQGHAEAQFNLARIYHFGTCRPSADACSTGVPRDNAEAAKWYHEAAERGHVGAQATLGVFYQGGRGVPKDLVISQMWFTVAAMQGDEIAEGAAQLNAVLLSPSQIDNARRLAREWFEEHGQ